MREHANGIRTASDKCVPGDKDRTKGKTQMLKAMLTVTFVAAMAVSQAVAMQLSSLGMKAKIPFAFETRGVAMPAGDYHLDRLTDGLVRIRESATNKSVAFLAIPTKGKGENGRGSLTFHRYGDRYFLVKITPPSGNAVAPSQTRSERELWSGVKGTSQVITIVAD
jgi:hypothetical protein